MTTWDTDQYLKFAAQRTQPAVDLAKRIAQHQPKSILDLGCGPGNSTAVLKQFFPQAEILGVDASANMIEKARQSDSEISFALCDATTDLASLGKFDLIFSNACLQWIPAHSQWLPKLFEHLQDGGVLAVQIPMNTQEPLFQILEDVLRAPHWNFSAVQNVPNGTLTPEEYFDILSACASDFDIWETVYYHDMPTVQSMVEWVKGTRLRPYLACLDTQAAADLEKEILTRASARYTPQANGSFLLKFRRFFFTATR